MLDLSLDDSSPLALAYRIRTFLVLLILAAISAVFALRAHTEYLRSRRARARGPAEATIGAWLEGKHAPLPRGGRLELLEFCKRWIHHVELVKGESRQALVTGAMTAGLPARLGKILVSGSPQERVLALRAARALPVPDLVTCIEPLLRRRDSLVLPAAEALVAIDPATAVDTVLPLVLTRRDWPEKRAVALYRSLAREDAATAGLIVEFALQQDPRMQVRVARFLGKCSGPQQILLLWELLRRTQDDTVLSACLDSLHDPAAAPLARHYLTHPRWHVRVHAVRALGRIGSSRDEPALIARLSDAQWWVRYRAAQALLALPLMREQLAKAIHDGLSDAFARASLRQAAAEVGHSWANEGADRA